MTPARLLEHFDRIAEAPGAVPRLRRFILDLAVRGKLVEQYSTDESTDDLLNNIRERKKLLKESNQIRTLKSPHPVAGEEKLFIIPPSWRWVRLEDIASYIQRGKSPQYADGNGLPVISQKCIQWSGLDLSKAKNVTFDSVARYEAARFLRDDDLLWNSTGTGTIGRIIRVISPQKDLICDSHVTIVRHLIVNAEYVRIWIMSDHVYGTIETMASGSTNQVELTSQMANNQVVPLPPLAEQHRIVTKVEELMGLCDQLEASRAKRESRRDRLVAASLQRIGQPEDTGNGYEFKENVHFHLNFLPRLTTRPEHIKELRQTILNLAVRGKLVSQDPNDEPASILLEKIFSRAREQSRERKKIQMHIEPVDEMSTPFDSPSGWNWVRLNSLFEVITDGDHQPPPKSDAGIPFLTIGNISTGTLDFTNCRHVNEDYYNSIPDYRKPSYGDILYTVVGATYGRPVLVDTKNKFCVQRHIAILKPFNDVDVNYLLELLRSPMVYEQASRSTTGTAQPTIPLKPLRRFIVPLPPLAEQHRIVAKVDELMGLCDQLESALVSAQMERGRLLEAVLREALGESGSTVVRAGRPRGQDAFATTASAPRARAARRVAPARPASPDGGEDTAPTPVQAGGTNAAPSPARTAGGDAPDAILAHMQPGRDYARGQLCDALGLSAYEWNRAIQDLKARGRVVQSGEKRGARYRLA